MALSGGNAEANTGLAGALYTALEGQFGPFSEEDQDSLFPFCDKLGEAIVGYVVTNAEVAVSVKTTDTGLQTSTTVGTATGGPAADKTITGTIS